MTDGRTDTNTDIQDREYKHTSHDGRTDTNTDLQDRE